MFVLKSLEELVNTNSGVKTAHPHHLNLFRLHLGPVHEVDVTDGDGGEVILVSEL